MRSERSTARLRCARCGQSSAERAAQFRPSSLVGDLEDEERERHRGDLEAFGIYCSPFQKKRARQRRGAGHPSASWRSNPVEADGQHDLGPRKSLSLDSGLRRGRSTRELDAHVPANAARANRHRRSRLAPGRAGVPPRDPPLSNAASHHSAMLLVPPPDLLRAPRGRPFAGSGAPRPAHGSCSDNSPSGCEPPKGPRTTSCFELLDCAAHLASFNLLSTTPTPDSTTRQPPLPGSATCSSASTSQWWPRELASAGPVGRGRGCSRTVGKATRAAPEQQGPP